MHAFILASTVCPPLFFISLESAGRVAVACEWVWVLAGAGVVGRARVHQASKKL